VRRLDLVFFDVILAGAATLSALFLRDNLDVSQERLATLGPYLLSTLFVTAGVVPALGLNRSVWRFTAIVDCLKVLIAALGIVLGTLAIAFSINRLEGVARALPILQAILIALAFSGIRILARLRYMARTRPRQPAVPSLTEHGETALIVGYGKLAELFLQSVLEFAPDRLRIVGVLGRTDHHTGRTMHGLPVLGTPQEAASVLQNLEVHGVTVDRIVVCAAFETLPAEAQRALLEVEKASDIAVDFLAERMRLEGKDKESAKAATSERSSTDQPPRVHLGDLRRTPKRPYWLVKRVLDFTGALALLVVLAPVVLFTATLVAIDVGLPICFWQQRPGQYGRPFRLYKFRTMVAAHDDRGERLPDDERLTAIGNFLRRSRLDELPQLFNILVGEMSFVGPRPLLPIDQPESNLMRLLIRSGLTGWAQVHGGRELTIEDKAALDEWYINHASLRLDARILLQTTIMLLRGETRNERAIEKACLELGIARRGGTGAPAPTTDRVLVQAARRAAV
jgi:lipopolysaccharide/colanic/teichoic acid biosynthesis glycosyltransferase